LLYDAQKILCGDGEKVGLFCLLRWCMQGLNLEWQPNFRIILCQWHSIISATY